MHCLHQQRPSSSAVSRRPRHVALLTLFLSLNIAAAASLTSVSHAQRSGVGAIVGEWVVRHGVLRHQYQFWPNGTYDYQRSAGYGSGQQALILENGLYAVEGDRLMLKPTDGDLQVLHWQMGSHWTSPGRPTLYLTYPNGRQEFFYPLAR